MRGFLKALLKHWTK